MSVVFSEATSSFLVWFAGAWVSVSTSIDLWVRRSISSTENSASAIFGLVGLQFPVEFMEFDSFQE